MGVTLGYFAQNFLQVIFNDEFDLHPKVLGKGMHQVIFRSGGTVRADVIGCGRVAGQNTQFTPILDLFEEVFLGGAGIENQRQGGRAKQEN